MIQLLEKKTGIRILVFTLLLTILAWLVPTNMEQVNAATEDPPSTTLLEQTIIGDSIFTKTYGDNAFDLRATAPGELTYSSNNPYVATVSRTGIVTITGIGTATITITAAETPTYQAATKLVTIIVEKPKQTISGLSSFTKVYGDDSFDLDADAPGTLSYESSNPQVVSVTAYGRVSIHGIGTATITIRAAETNQYAAATKSVYITVGKGGQVIEGEYVFERVYGDSPFNLNQKAEGTLSYESKNPEIATVDSDGTVTIIGVGTAVIEITAASTAVSEAETKLVRVIVEKGEQPITVAASFTKTYGSGAFSLGASAPGELYYQSSNNNVASVSEEGIVTLEGPGTAIITITAAETELYQQTFRSVKLTVTAPKPKAVTIKSAKSSKEGQMTVSWSKLSGVSGYQVVLGQNKSCTSGKKVKAVSSKNSSTTVTGLAKGTTYYAKVRAYKTISGKKYYGNYSKIKSAKTKGSSIRLKDYQKKIFGSKVYSNNEIVRVFFKKASGKKIKLFIQNGTDGSDNGYTTETVTGTLTGNKLKFKVNHYVGFKEVNGELVSAKYPLKLSGTIHFVNKKTIKITITSRQNFDDYVTTFRLLKKGKTTTLKLE